MTSERQSTRRRFLKSATVLTVAATSVSGQRVFAESDLKKARKPRAKKIELGIKPEASTAGPVVVETGRNVYLTFYGCKEDKRGKDMGDGTAMITFWDCHQWRLRKPGDEEVPSHSIDSFELDYCEAYRVTGSDWKPQPNKQTTSTTKPEDLRHFIFTFFGFNPELIGGGTNFECLAKSMRADFFKDAEFDSLKELMVARELTSDSRRTRSKIN